MAETPAQTDNDSEQPATALERCPICRYSLKGLPAAHCCPECGLAYDEHTRVWRGALGWLPKTACLLGAVGSFVVAAYGWDSHVRSQSVALGILSPWPSVWYCLLQLVFGCSLIRLALAKPFIAITATEVIYRGIWIRRRHIPWSDIWWIGYDQTWVRKRIAVGFPNGRDTTLPDRVLKHGEMEEFDRVASEALERYRESAK